jgi:hypothetical protein
MCSVDCNLVIDTGGAGNITYLQFQVSPVILCGGSASLEIDDERGPRRSERIPSEAQLSNGWKEILFK